MKLSLFAFALVSIFSLANAQTSHPTTCGDNCDQPPAPAEPNNSKFSYDLAKSLWESGTIPAIGELTGTWIAVGEASTPGANIISENQYDQNGLKNSDGSNKFQLEIRAGGPTGETDFAGNPVTRPNSVLITGLGNSGASQGPNELNLSQERQAACFAQYGYSDSSLTKSHLNSECRFLKNFENKMVCSIKLILDPSEEISESIKQWDGKVVGYHGYLKIK